MWRRLSCFIAVATLLQIVEAVPVARQPLARASASSASQPKTSRKSRKPKIGKSLRRDRRLASEYDRGLSFPSVDDDSNVRDLHGDDWKNEFQSRDLTDEENEESSTEDGTDESNNSEEQKGDADESSHNSGDSEGANNDEGDSDE